MTQNADCVRVMEERFRSAVLDAKAATEADQQAYWWGMADAYADAASIIDPAHVMSPVVGAAP